MAPLQSYLSVKKRRIVVDISDFHGEGADSFQAGFSRVNGLDCDGDELPVFTLSVKDFVGKHFASLFVHIELGSLLMRLLDNGVPDLTVHTLILVHSVHLNHWTSVWSTFFNLGSVRGAVLKHGFVVVDICDKDHDDGGRGVEGRVTSRAWLGRIHAALAIVHGRHVQLVLVTIQIDGACRETDDARVLLDPKQSRLGCAAYESELDTVSVLVGGNDRRDQGVGAGVLVHIRGVDLLRKFRLLVVLVLCVDADGGRARARRFTFVLGGNNELIIGVVAVRVQSPIVGNDPLGVDGEMIVGDVVLDLGVVARVGVRGPDLKNGGSDRNVLVHVMGLVVGKFELGSIVVYVRNANRQLKIRRREKGCVKGSRRNVRFRGYFYVPLLWLRIPRNLRWP